MRTFVRFRLDDGDIRELGPGDIIGRSWSSTLCLADPGISEAHALVSLRGASLKLLALRGRFAVDDRTVSEIELVAGLRVRLTREIGFEVIEVQLPDEVLALEAEGFPRQILEGTCSLRAKPRPELVPGFHPDADASLWSDGVDWMLRLGSTRDDDRPLVPGDTFEVAGLTFKAVGVALGNAGYPTTAAFLAVGSPLHLIVRYDTVHIHREIEPSLALDGISARILSELAVIKLPIAWEALAKEIWPDDSDLVSLRRKWDTSVARLRRKLRDARIRPNLIRADGTGNVEIYLMREDQVDDQT